jgi:hypothetical protein
VEDGGCSGLDTIGPVGTTKGSFLPSFLHEDGARGAPPGRVDPRFVVVNLIRYVSWLGLSLEKRIWIIKLEPQSDVYLL